MAKAKKSKSSKVAKKVEAIKKSPPKPKKVKEGLTDKEVCDKVSTSLWIGERNVFEAARAKVGDDLSIIRESVLIMEKETQQNYGNITGEIDKFKKISE